MFTHYRLIFGILLILGILWLLFVKCDVKQEPVKLQAVNPKYLQIYSISQSQDSTHTIVMAGPEGNVWYSETTPILDLSHLDVQETYTENTPFEGKEYRVILAVRQPFQQDIAAWSRDHIEGYAGVMIKGKLVQVEKLHGAIYGRIAISFSSYEEAHKAANEIRSGGFYDNQVSITANDSYVGVNSNDSRVGVTARDPHEYMFVAGDGYKAWYSALELEQIARRYADEHKLEFTFEGTEKMVWVKTDGGRVLANVAYSSGVGQPILYIAIDRHGRVINHDIGTAICGTGDGEFE